MSRARLVFTILFSLSLFDALSQKKLALIIGNGKYLSASELRNPVNDAAAISGQLNALGFTVTLKENLDYITFRQCIVAFKDSINDKDFVFFFYAGHGIQVDEKNYLIPIDAKLDKKTDVPFEAIYLEDVLRSLEISNPNGLNVLVLDACRNNPFKSWERGGNDGLALVRPPSGTIIAFSTSPGSVASDGEGSNGLYTSILKEQLGINQRIEDIFIQTRNEVERLSGGRQSPWELSRLRGVYFLNTDSTKKGANVVPERIQVNNQTVTKTGLSGVVTTRQPKDKQNIEISVFQNEKLFDVVYTDEKGKFAYTLSNQIDPLDTIDLHFIKAGLEEKWEKFIPNSRGIVKVSMARDVSLSKSSLELGFALKNDGPDYSRLFSGQYLYHTPWLKKRFSIGASFSSLQNTDNLIYELLPGQFETKISSATSIIITAPAHLYAFPYDHKRDLNAYIEFQIPIVTGVDRLISASVGVSLRLNPYFRIEGDLRYLNYGYEAETISFNPYGSANVTTLSVKKKGFFPGLSIQYFLRKSPRII